MPTPVSGPLSPVSSAVSRARELTGQAQESASFADVFKRALQDTSSLQTDAQDTIAAFLRGEPVELHQVMAASEEAAISLELLVEIRNKLTDAYRAVMNVT